MVTYPEFIRKQRCVACGTWPSEFAHFADGTSGVAKKSQDENALPLCSECHRTGKHAYHAIGEGPFVELWEIDVAAERERLRRSYVEQSKGIPRNGIREVGACSSLF